MQQDPSSIDAVDNMQTYTDNVYPLVGTIWVLCASYKTGIIELSVYTHHFVITLEDRLYRVLCILPKTGLAKWYNTALCHCIRK